MSINTEINGSNPPSPEKESFDDIIAKASEIARLDMGETPPPPRRFRTNSETLPPPPPPRSERRGSLPPPPPPRLYREPSTQAPVEAFAPSDVLDESASAEDARNITVSKIDVAIKNLKTDETMTDTQKWSREKELRELREFVPSYFGVNNTAGGYMEAVQKTEIVAMNKQDQLNKQHFQTDTEKDTAEAAIRKEMKLANMLNSPHFLPKVTKTAA